VVYIPPELTYSFPHFDDSKYSFSHSLYDFEKNLVGIVIAGCDLSWDWEGPRLKVNSVRRLRRLFGSVPIVCLSPNLTSCVPLMHAVGRVATPKFGVKNYDPKANVNILVSPIKNPKKIYELFDLIPDGISDPRQISKTFIYHDDTDAGIRIAMVLRAWLRKKLPGVDADNTIMVYFETLDCAMLAKISANVREGVTRILLCFSDGYKRI
jgi:hypothetical protein